MDIKGIDNKKILCVIILGIVLGFASSLVNVLIAIAVVAIAAAAVFIMLDWQRSVYVLAGYAVADYVLRTFAGGIASLWDEAFLCLLVLIWIFKWIVYGKTKAEGETVKVSPMDLPIIVFIGVMLFVLLVNSGDFSIGVEGFRAIAQYMLWYFIVIQLVHDQNGARKIAVCFAFVAGIMAIHGVLQYVAGVEMPAGWVDQNEAGVRTRVYSILTSPNVFGSMLILSTPVSAALALSAKDNKKRFIFGFLALMMTASLVFTFSRGAWIGFAVACAVYIIMKDKRLIIPAVIFAVLVVVCVPSVGNRIAYMLSPEYIESSLRGGRLVRWMTGLRILQFYPVLGVGLGQFGGAVAMNHNLQLMLDCGYQRTFYMDNYFLKTAVESGIVGFCAFAALMYSVIINAYRTVRMAARAGDNAAKELCIGIMAGLIGVIVHNWVENVFETPLMSSLFWMLAGVIMAVWYSLRSAERSKENQANAD